MKKHISAFIFVLFTSIACLSSASATNYYSTIVKDQYIGKICIGFKRPVSSTWNSILETAVSNYNAAFEDSTKLGFCYNPYIDANIYKETFEIRVEVSNFGNTGWDGKGTFPSKWTGKPGKSIQINTREIYKLDFQEKVALLMHEIGHNIGLCHTDSPRGCKAIPGTSSYARSLFREQTGDNGYKYPNFSSADEIAIKYMY